MIHINGYINSIPMLSVTDYGFGLCTKRKKPTSLPLEVITATVPELMMNSE